MNARKRLGYHFKTISGPVSCFYKEAVNLLEALIVSPGVCEQFGDGEAERLRVALLIPDLDAVVVVDVLRDGGDADAGAVRELLLRPAAFAEQFEEPGT